MKIYLAGPLFTQAEREFNSLLDSQLCERLPTIDFALPQRFCQDIHDDKLIMEKCRDELRLSDIVLVNCDGPDVDSGTAFEAGLAYALGIKIIAYRTDFRRAGDCHLNMNLMIGYAGEVVTDYGNDIIAKLVKAIRKHI